MRFSQDCPLNEDAYYLQYLIYGRSEKMYNMIFEASNIMYQVAKQSCVQAPESSENNSTLQNSSLRTNTRDASPKANQDSYQQGKQSAIRHDSNSPSSEIAVRKRKPSFMQLENDKQIIMEKMIREEIQMQRKLNRKMSLDGDESSLCTSGIYSRESVHWNNREISQLTTKKLDNILIESIKKIKVLREQPMAGYNLFKVSIGEKEGKDFAIKTIDIPTWFANSIWVILAHGGNQVNIKREFDGEIEGYILKKSQFLGNWELRYISISTKNGLVSCKKKDCSSTVRIKETSQLWTRFEIVTFQDIKYVVIKTWHMMFKYEFGVPVADCVRWAKALSSLVK